MYLIRTNKERIVDLDSGLVYVYYPAHDEYLDLPHETVEFFHVSDAEATIRVEGFGFESTLDSKAYQTEVKRVNAVTTRFWKHLLDLCIEDYSQIT